MRRATPLPDELRDRAFSVREARELGLTPSQLRSVSLARPFTGIRSGFEPVDLEVVHAFAPRMPARAFMYGITAARIHGLRVPARMTRSILPLHVAVPAGQRRVAARDIHPHHVSIGEIDLDLVGGVRVTGIERTWCDLATCGVSLGELVAAGDGALWMRAPHTDIDRLRAAVDRFEGRRGAALIRTALPLLSERADSAPESELRVAFAAAGLPTPQVNRAIVVDGRRLGAPDLSWPNQRVAVEYEGDHHRTDRDQWHRDIERYARLQEAGWVVIRATAADYRDPSALIARVARALRARGH